MARIVASRVDQTPEPTQQRPGKPPLAARLEALAVPPPPKPRSGPIAKPKGKLTHPTKLPKRQTSDKRALILPPENQEGLSAEDKAKIRSDKSNLAQRAIRISARDIAPLPKITEENWALRLECKTNFKLFCETFMDAIFYLGWSDDQLKCVEKIEQVFMRSGKFALAMPRGGGKSALSRASILWGTAYGYKHFPFFIGSKAEKAEQTLDAVKTYWFQSRKLREVFPEIAYPIYKIENRWHLAKAQTFHGIPTHIEWGADTIVYPSLLLREEDAKQYLDNDPDSVVFLPEYQMWMAASAGTHIRTAGIDGSIRGEAETHPITLAQPRPDLVILDDVQKDQQAESPIQVLKLKMLIAGALMGLSGPDISLSALMPCTVTREGDVSDDYLDPFKHPEWRGERCGLVNKWPEGITDTEISLDTEAGRAWNRYNDLRKESYRIHGDIRLATEYYIANRNLMDTDFEVSWKDRFDAQIEVSAQQYAMNLRMENPATFIAEYQNKGRKMGDGAIIPISAEQLCRKVIGVPRNFLPINTAHLVAFIDVQDEILFYGVFACGPDFTGCFVDYGTYPKLHTCEFTKNDTKGWGLLTKEFFEAYPEQKLKIVPDDNGRIRAPLEAKIYHALDQATKFLSEKVFHKADQFETERKIDLIGIDSRWGQVNSTIKTFIRHCGIPKIVPCIGMPFPPTQRQIHQMTRHPGMLFESQVNTLTKEDKWYFSPDASGQLRMTTDVNLTKTFLLERFASPPGSSGSISLYAAPPEEHYQFAKHICDSEYPTRVKTDAIEKDMWAARQGDPDNDMLDVAVGCMSLASKLGAHVLPAQIARMAKKKEKLSDLYNRKRASRQG